MGSGSVWYFSTFNYVVIPKGVSESRVFISGRAALRDLAFSDHKLNVIRKHKVPPTYSRAEESARSLYGRRDDEFFVKRDFKLYHYQWMTVQL